MEQWRDVPSHRGWYEVSDYGRVRRAVTAPAQGRTTPGKILKPFVDADGYAQVGLCVGGTSTNVKVHHKDGDKLNNHPSNLEWVTLAENTRHAFGAGLCDNTGQKHGMAKLSDFGARVIRRLCPSSLAQREIAAAFGVSQATVSNICRGIGWKGVRHGAQG